MLGAVDLIAGFVITVIQLPTPTDSATAWLRLAVAMLIATIGGVGMWSVVVALPTI